MSIPGMVEAAATNPSKSVGVPRLVAKGFSTGFLDMVELRMAKVPIMQITTKNFSLAFFGFSCIDKPAYTVNLGMFIIFHDVNTQLYF